jgi:hypothetical protein
MPLDWLIKGFAGAKAWAVRPARAPVERGRAVELPN